MQPVTIKDAYTGKDSMAMLIEEIYKLRLELSQLNQTIREVGQYGQYKQ